MDIKYRQFDLQNEDFSAITALFEATYGEVDRFKKRSRWQYFGHPWSGLNRILVADHDGHIAGVSSHLPFPLLVEGRRLEAFYASDSMVHPDYRRRGIMETLTRMNAESLPVIYAKGTNPGMYRLRLKFGFRDVVPNNYMFCLLAPIAWLAAKMKIHRKKPAFIDGLRVKNLEARPVVAFGDEFDQFWAAISPKYPGISIRDKSYMNWRYLSHPFKEYRPVYIAENGRPVSLFVVRGERYSAYIVDILWDYENKDEPSTTLKILKRYLKKSGFNKIYFWATLKTLRLAMKRNGFVELRDTPKFTVFGPPDRIGRLADGGNFHFVDGDCDSEYL